MKRNTAPNTRGSAALYDPYLDTLGGGEKHILSILKVLEDEGYDVTVFWDNDLKKDIQQKFNLHFNSLGFLPNLFKLNFLDKLKKLNRYDIFFYITDGSYFFSSAGKNYIFAMVPNPALYNLNTVNKLKTLNFSFIANSLFTHSYIKKFGIETKTIYPFIPDDFFTITPSLEKKDVILTVGRFFPHLHSKRQEILIETFRRLKKDGAFKSTKLILAGSVHPDDQDYLNNLKISIVNDPSIELKVNVSYPELKCLYQTSKYFWHFTGYGVDEEKEPEKVEHLGITPLEAMAGGAIVFCYKAGGPKELIRNRETGFLFLSDTELLKDMKEISQNEDLQEKIRQEAHDFVKTNFSYEAFKKQVKKVILNQT